MIYLKRYNESITDDIESMQNFCEVNLAYLLDDGFDVTVFNRRRREFCKISIRKSLGNSIFKWSEIEKYFLPFLHFLTREYESYLPHIYIRYKDLERPRYSSTNFFEENYTMSQVLSDGFQFNSKCVNEKELLIGIDSIVITGIKIKKSK